MAAVDILRPIVGDAGEAASRRTGPVMDGNNPAARDIGMGRSGRAAAQTGVGNGGDLRRAVVPTGVRSIGSDADSRAKLVVFFGQDVPLDPGYVQHIGHGCELISFRSN